MDRHLRAIDHVLVAVRELEEAAERWRALGFTLTPPGRHPQWGTANRCIMFEDGYIELLAFSGEGPRNRPELERFLATRGEGIFGLALASDDAQATAEAWRSLGFSASGPHPLARRLDRDGGVELRFVNVLLPSEELEGLLIFACQHLTPELLRRSEWLRHANGARRLGSITLHAEPTDAVVSVLERLFGTATESRTDNVTGFHFDGASVLVMPDEDVQLLHPVSEIREGGCAPHFVALSVMVERLEDTRAALASRRIAVREIPHALAVAPAAASGVVLEFTT